MPITGPAFPDRLEIVSLSGGDIAIPHLYADVSPVSYGGTPSPVDNFLSAATDILVCGVNQAGWTGLLRMTQNTDFSIVPGTAIGFRLLRDAVITWVSSRQANSSPTTPTLELYQQRVKVKEIAFGGIVSMNEGCGAGDELAFAIKAGAQVADHPVVTIGLRWLHGSL